MSGTLRDLTAGFNASEGTYTPPQLFAGEQDIVTTSLPLAASTAVAARQVLAFNSSNNLVVFDPAGAAPTNVAVAIALEAAASSGSVREIPVYIGGNFFDGALGWPAATNTIALRRAAFARTNITITPLGAVRAD